MIIRIVNGKVTDKRADVESMASLPPKLQVIFSAYQDYTGAIPEGIDSLTALEFVDGEIVIDEVIEAERVQDIINQEAEQYLKDTDKWAVREWETSILMPSGVRAERAAARERVIK